MGDEIKNINEYKKEEGGEPYNLEIMSLKELKKVILPKGEFLIEQFVPRLGITMIHGNPGSFKTFFALQMAASIVKQELFLGLYKTKKTKVLIINLDDIPGQLMERFNFLNIKDENFNDLYLLKNEDANFNINNDTHLDNIAQKANELKIGLIIIDTLRLCHKQDENSSQEMTITMNNLKRLSSLINSAIILCHHNAKSIYGVSGALQASGSHVIAGSCVSTVGLKEAKGNNIIMQQGKSKVCKKLDGITTLEFSEKNYPLFKVVDNKRDKITDEDAKECIVDFYKENPNPGLSKEEIIQQYSGKWKVSKEQINRAYGSLISEGILKLALMKDGKKYPNNKKVYELAEADASQSNYSGP